MTTEKKRLYAIVAWSSFFAIPISAGGLFAFYAGAYIKPYLITAYISHFFALLVLIFRRNHLFWYFTIILFTLFTSLALGFALNTGALLVLAFGKYVPANLILIGTLTYFMVYCYFPFKYYYYDYHRTENDRLKSFDFKNGTYDIKHPTLLRGDSFADYYTMSFLAKAHYRVIKFHLFFPISGGAIAIIAGKLSKNIQLSIGLLAAYLSTILFLQIVIPGIFNAWQVYRLEKKYGKKIIIDWGKEE
ncbi:MAG: hypothetical protein JW915_16070 [Chitinispirillaceae bacterium]|nr:hypothetical protein [Chitinispirillaceae bacterium]